MMLHRYGSGEWWEAVGKLLPKSVWLPNPLRIGLVDISSDGSTIVQTSTMMWEPESGFSWVLGAMRPFDMQLIRPIEIAAGDLLRLLSAADILAATAIRIDGASSDILGISGRATRRWVGLANASGAIQCDVIDSPFGDVTLYLCADKGVLTAQLCRPAVIDGIIKLEYVRLLRFTTAQCSRIALLDQYDEAAFDFAVMSVVEACLSPAADRDVLPALRVFEVLSAFSALRAASDYRTFVDALGEITAPL